MIIPSEQELIIAAQDSLLSFTIMTHHDYAVNWHHRLIASKLMDVMKGKIKRLIISIPPRHGKTELVSIRFPAWYLGNLPRSNIVAATYNGDFATDNSRKVRDIIGSDLYREVFAISLSKSAKAAGKFYTDKNGYYYSVGIGGGLTGRGADLLIIDDPHKDRAEAESEIKRKRVWEWFTSTAYTRLEKNAAVIVVMTRWHEDDLVGKLLAQEEKWEYLCLPAIAEETDKYRQEGEPLWPDKYNLEALDNIKSTLTQETGSAKDWASLYQQKPAPDDGNIFKADSWRFYTELPKPVLIVQSWDTAFKTKDTNDFNVCTTWAVCNDGYYLLDIWKKRAEFPEVKRILMELAEQYNPGAILVEDKASGQSVIQEMRTTRLPIIPIRPDVDKISRAVAATPLIASGRVYLPSGKGWVNDYITSLAYFPNGKHDDDVDSTTQFLNWTKTLQIKKEKSKFSLSR